MGRAVRHEQQGRGGPRLRGLPERQVRPDPDLSPAQGTPADDSGGADTARRRGTVEAVAAADDDGTRTIAVWNFTLDQTKRAGAAELARDVVVEVTGLEPGAAYDLTHERVDQEHSNIAGVWGRIREGDQAWPTDDQWRVLREADRLEEAEPARQVTADASGAVRVETALPMPAMSLLTLRPGA